MSLFDSRVGWAIIFNSLQVNPDDSKWNVGPRDVQFILMRKEEGEYWDKLQKGAKIVTLKVDWDKWKDEDEVDASVRLIFPFVCPSRFPAAKLYLVACTPHPVKFCYVKDVVLILFGGCR